MSQLHDTLMQYLMKTDMGPVEDMGEAVRVYTRGDNAKHQLLYTMDDTLEHFKVYVVFPHMVPKEKRGKMAKFLCRMNCDLPLGCCEMDWRIGSVRYRVGVDVEGGKLTEMMIHNMTGTAVMVMDKYLPGMMSLLFGDCKVKEAIRKVEGDPAPLPAFLAEMG